MKGIAKRNKFEPPFSRELAKLPDSIYNLIVVPTSMPLRADIIL